MSNTLGLALQGGRRGGPRRVTGSPSGALCGGVDGPRPDDGSAFFHVPNRTVRSCTEAVGFRQQHLDLDLVREKRS